MHTRDSCKAHEEKQRKKFVGQQLWVTLKTWLSPKSWLVIWNFVFFWMFFYMSISCAWSKIFSETLCYASLIYWIVMVSWCESCTPYSSKTKIKNKIGFHKHFCRASTQFFNFLKQLVARTLKHICSMCKMMRVV